MKNIFIISAIVFFTSNTIFSQTTILGGNVSGNWTLNNSPYLIEGDILIASGNALLIEPGVTVEFQGHYKLTVNGKLTATGVQDSLIKFTINDTTGFSNINITNGSWAGIYFENNVIDTSKLIFCKIEYGKKTYNENNNAIILSNQYSNLIILNSIVTNNVGWYFSVINLNNFLIFSNNKVQNNRGFAIMLSGNQNSTFSNNLICNNTEGIVIPVFLNFNIVNTTICNNSGRGIFTYESCSFDIYNSIIYGNDSYQISADASGVSVFNCDIENGLSGFSPMTFISDYINNIDLDPQFIAPTSGTGVGYNALNANWNLQATSPCIDAGTADTSGLNLHLPLTDLGGNPRIFNNIIDIGAYEYPGFIFVEEINYDNDISVFPNPGKETITVNIINVLSKNIELQIYNQSGVTVYSEEVSNKMPNLNKELNLSAYSKGVYYLKIKYKEQEYTKKIIIQ